MSNKSAGYVEAGGTVTDSSSESLDKLPECSNMDVELSSDYTKFDPEEYLNSYCGKLAIDPFLGAMWIKEMQFFHEVFSTNKIKGQRLLDIGSGPTIRSVISASAHVDSIYLSDFAPQNREILKTWLDGTLQHSWESYFKYVVDAENTGETPGDKERTLRKKISGICHIDLLQDYPLAPSFFPQFDVITTALCFRAAAENPEAYKKIARRVAGMLRKGGHLMLFSHDSTGNSYKVGEVMFRSLEIKSDEVRDIWKSCGFEIVDWKQERDSAPGFQGGGFYFLMVAKKVCSR